MPIPDHASRARSPGQGDIPEAGFNALVPEFDVTDLDRSLAFWCGPIGFRVAYDRPAARFAYLARGPAQVMLCERNGHRQTAGLEPPSAAASTCRSTSKPWTP